MVQREFAQHLLPTRSEADVNLAAILGPPITLDEIFFFEAAYQLDCAVMLNLQALGEVGNTRAVAASGAAQGQHKLMVLRLDACTSRCLLTEM